MKVERMKWITREIVKANPDKLFLFGDNYERQGLGGQAKEMRGEPNAYGIATKVRPDNRNGAFFTDAQYRFHCGRLFGEFEGVKHLLRVGDFTSVVIPEDGLGTGLADLPNRAPKVFAYLQTKLQELEELND